MTAILVLDTTAVGLAANPRGSPQFDDWFAAAAAVAVIVVPAVSDFEVRRELIRIDSRISLARLDRFVRTFRYEEVNTARWHIAAHLWADARNRGRPTADSKSLDIDVLVAATAISLQSEGEVVVVTANVRHLSQFVDARLWSDITLP
ncbi:MAG: PIN domain-containing protein [Dehalococcoidia bacterium]